MFIRRHWYLTPAIVFIQPQRIAAAEIYDEKRDPKQP